MSKQRRNEIKKALEENEMPISATTLAKELGVTRQVIVGDVALLRASGIDVVATPRGYILEKEQEIHYRIASKHNEALLYEELYTIIDHGCGVIDVTIEHPLYGEITCNLRLFSRRDIEEYKEKFETSNSRPLSQITGDIHLHRLQCPSEKHFEQVKQALREKGILQDENGDSEEQK